LSRRTVLPRCSSAKARRALTPKGVQGMGVQTNAPVSVTDESEASFISRTGLRPSTIVNGAFVLGVLVVLLFVCLFVPNFATSGNILSLIVQASTLGLMAIGLTFTLITGGFDLSIPYTAALSAIVGAKVMQITNTGLGLLVIFVVGATVGLVNGVVVTKLRVNAFIATLAMMTILGGLNTWITGGKSSSNIPQGFLNFMLADVAGVPVPVIIFIAMAIVAHFVLHNSLYGRWVYGLGINSSTARVTGMPTEATRISVYVVSGVLASAASIILTARFGASGPMMATRDLVIEVVVAAIAGGVSYYGGRGSVLGACGGAFFVAAIINAMNLLNFSAGAMLLGEGGLIVLVLYLTVLRRAATARRPTAPKRLKSSSRGVVR
jgi:ribose transport system permease protein